MDIGQQVAGTSAAKRCFLRRLKDEVGSACPIIITPELFKTLDYQLTEIKGTVIFMGFDHIDPLIIPTRSVIHGDLWLVNCVFKAAKHIAVEGDIHFLSTELTINPGYYQMTVRGTWSMDKESWRYYFREKKKGKLLGNHGIRVYDATEQESRFKDLYHSLPHVDLIEYLNDAFSVPVLQNLNDSGYSVEGNVLICGPYPYTIPDNMTIKGDIILKDHYDQRFPDTLSVSGQVTVLSYF